MSKPRTGVTEDADVRGDEGTPEEGEQQVEVEVDVDRAAALLDPDGGGGAELRGHVPDDPAGVVLVLHGGAENSLMPVVWWRLAVLRMKPFASAIERRAGDHVAVLRLKYRVRGWNGTRQDPVQDARWALDRIRHVLPDVPVVLVGHSMGGRVALRLAADPGVVGVAALAPWVESDSVQARPDTPVLLVHGSKDRVTDPRRTAVLASRLYDRGVDVRSVTIEGDSHAMLRDAGAWHRLVRDFVIDVLDPDRTS
ncbi:alpha/beta hydrolase [Oryzobacter telluris]|uniref:alpha/beta hydrolase n=1 Tax=Oryzobacter telluris TaxID=3149179 RepID=UPI00370D4F69